MKSGEKLEKVVKSGEKLEKVGKGGKNGEKWIKVGKSWKKLEKVGERWKKWGKIGKSGKRWGKVRKVGKSGEKLEKVGKSEEKWGRWENVLFKKFGQNGRRRPFWMSENNFRSQFLPFQIDWTTMSVIELVRDIWMNNACVKFEERSLNPSKVIALTTK